MLFLGLFFVCFNICEPCFMILAIYLNKNFISKTSNNVRHPLFLCYAFSRASFWVFRYMWAFLSWFSQFILFILKVLTCFAQLGLGHLLKHAVQSRESLSWGENKSQVSFSMKIMLCHPISTVVTVVTKNNDLCSFLSVLVGSCPWHIIYTYWRQVMVRHGVQFGASEISVMCHSSLWSKPPWLLSTYINKNPNPSSLSQSHLFVILFLGLYIPFNVIHRLSCE